MEVSPIFLAEVRKKGTERIIASSLADCPAEVTEDALAARRLLFTASPETEETLDTSARVIGYGCGPGCNGVDCTLILSRTVVQSGVVRGSGLADPNQLMGGEGNAHRHVPLQSIADVEAGLSEAVDQNRVSRVAREERSRRVIVGPRASRCRTSGHPA